MEFRKPNKRYFHLYITFCSRQRSLRIRRQHRIESSSKLFGGRTYVRRPDNKFPAKVLKFSGGDCQNCFKVLSGQELLCFFLELPVSCCQTKSLAFLDSWLGEEWCGRWWKIHHFFSKTVVVYTSHHDNSSAILALAPFLHAAPLCLTEQTCKQGEE